MTDEVDTTHGKSDDVRHLEQAITALADPRSARMTAAINLLGEILALVPRLQWSDMFPNNLAALACHARSYRDLRAAVTLLTWGYYGQVRAILRGVYESATVGRILAKEPPLADKWLKRKGQFPEKDVRRWAVESGLIAEADNEYYVKMYQLFGRWAHPTLDSSHPYIKTGEEAPVLQINTEFNSEAFFTRVTEIATMAVFCCFAVRNAAVDEKAIDPDWRQRLSALAPQILGRDMPHLERDWDEERRQYAALRSRIQSVAGMAEHLQRNPASWQNVKSAEPTGD